MCDRVMWAKVLDRPRHHDIWMPGTNLRHIWYPSSCICEPRPVDAKRIRVLIRVLESPTMPKSGRSEHESAA